MRQKHDWCTQGDGTLCLALVEEKAGLKGGDATDRRNGNGAPTSFSTAGMVKISGPHKQHRRVRYLFNAFRRSSTNSGFSAPNHFLGGN